MKHVTAFAVLVCFCLAADAATAQARLTIVNRSQRDLTVKVMKASAYDATLHDTVRISPLSSETILFSESGTYFTKSMAAISGRSPIYRKGDAFEVYNGRDGYSVMTITFTIVESAQPEASGGKEISRLEFEQNTTKR